MEFKKKLIISFIGMVIVPVFLILVFGVSLVQIQVLALRFEYGIDVSASDLMQSSSRIVDSLAQSLRDDLDEKQENDPDFFLDDASLGEYCDRHTTENMEIVVFRDGNLVWESVELSEAITQSLLTELSDDSAMIVRHIDDTSMAFCRLADVEAGDGSRVMICTVVYLGKWLPHLRRIAVQGFFSILFILLLTAALFTVWIYRSIIKPVDVLKDATEKIRDGNLNFKIKADENDEMGRLCNGFEEMRKRLKDSAEAQVQYDADSKELISNISHDLRTPLTAIKGYCEGILDGVADTPEKQQRYVRTIYNKAIDMDRLLDELTFYSKIDSNRIPYNFVPLPVAGYFGDCAEELAMELEAKNTRFQFINECDAEEKIVADPEQLRRVINNIVSNALKYNDKEICAIRMRVRDTGSMVEVDMEDNGQGIAAADLERIFERFYRTDASRNSSRGGSGIGLSIVHKIIQDHGGAVWADSVEGAGTVISFTLRKYYPEVREDESNIIDEHQTDSSEIVNGEWEKVPEEGEKDG